MGALEQLVDGEVQVLQREIADEIQGEAVFVEAAHRAHGEIVRQQIDNLLPQGPVARTAVFADEIEILFIEGSMCSLSLH